jgi:hypothetical protein
MAQNITATWPPHARGTAEEDHAKNLNNRWNHAILELRPTPFLSFSLKAIDKNAKMPYLNLGVRYEALSKGHRCRGNSVVRNKCY